ncbi:MAG: phospholipid/cholesterol/gamma-HCH transport system ATP-binding protein [Salibacteraceae bacterium]|jgi:phospholipid/cholesterol/gamma-HCH transport system ATP-binding protein
MIEVKNLVKNFGEKPVLRDISFKFEKGKNNLIIGASGSGKTTMTKCIVGLQQPDQGTVEYNGASFWDMSRKETAELRQSIGFLFQGGALFDFMTVEENVKFALRVFSNMTMKEMNDRVDFCLDRVNLHGVKTLFPDELSGGMKKRVGIARAISMKPKYLFCDEPNSGLDPQTSILIDQLISEITYEYDITTIVITHDMNSVLEIGDNIMFLHQGKKFWSGSRTDILETENKELTDFIYASNFMKTIRDKSR